jgi:hypothetical protein
MSARPRDQRQIRTLGSVESARARARSASATRTRSVRKSFYPAAMTEAEPTVSKYARYRRVLGDDHPDTLRSACNLASDLHNLGDHQAARDLNQDILTRRRRVLGDDDPDTLASACNLASDLHNLGDHQTARRLEVEIRRWGQRGQRDDATSPDPS